MAIYDTLRDYAENSGIKYDPASVHPELGHSLSLFHTSLVESGLEHDGPEGKQRLTALPLDIDCFHISQFIVGFLPFNSVTRKEEVNHVLFEVYSWFKWLEKKNISHGLAGIDRTVLFKELCAMQERCLKLSHLLDKESGRILDDPPEIINTLNDVFTVQKIERETALLKGQRDEDLVRLRLPEPVINLVRLNDSMDLVLGDTSERWVLLEAGQVFPAYSPTRTEAG